MNIFILDYDVKKCAQYHVDKHVVKMILETAQLLCGVHHPTSCLIKIILVQYGQESHYRIIYTCVNWVWSYVRNTLTDMEKDINLRMLLNGV